MAFGSCTLTENTTVAEVRERSIAEKYRESTQSYVIKDIIYIRDDRTKPALCFAYMWGGSSRGGPSLAEVPCENVRHLLAPSQQEKMIQEEAAK